MKHEPWAAVSVLDCSLVPQLVAKMELESVEVVGEMDTSDYRVGSLRFTGMLPRSNLLSRPTSLSWPRWSTAERCMSVHCVEESSSMIGTLICRSWQSCVASWSSAWGLDMSRWL